MGLLDQSAEVYCHCNSTLSLTSKRF